jgi:radical SAM protein with 4Fe4S-binding SPASM domain
MGFYRKKMITFFINEECNMKCIYCPIHSDNAPKKDKRKVIDLDFAKRGIDDYFFNDFFNKKEKKAIRIFANGEAMLEFKTVKNIIDYARQKAKNNLFVEMQTNGYFNEKKALWIAKNIDLLWFSLDGLQEIQDKQRPTVNKRSSFNIIDKNISIINKFKKTKIGIRATISEYNVYKQKELIDYALKNKLIAVFADPWGSLKKEKGKPDLRIYADEFLRTWEYARKKNMIYGNEMTVNFDEEVEIYCRSCIPAPQFTPDSYVSSCDMVNNKDSFLVKLFPELIFGKYNKKENKIYYNQKNIKKIKSRNIYNLKDCQNCSALKHCAGGCIGIAMSSSFDFYGKNDEYCKVTKYLFKKMSDIINKGYNEKIPIHP